MTHREHVNGLRWFLLISCTVLYGIPTLYLTITKGPMWIMIVWGGTVQLIGIWYFWAARVGGKLDHGHDNNDVVRRGRIDREKHRESVLKK